jgi:hypothetical protein
MGRDTKAVLTKGTTIEDIVTVLKQKYTFVEVNSSRSSFFRVFFMDWADHRQLFVSFDSESVRHDTGIDGVYLNLSLWGNAVEILRGLCETFGGYLKEDDSNDEPFIPINYELFAKGKEFTKMDEFRHKVMAELGYDNLEKAMKLLEEYRNI